MWDVNAVSAAVYRALKAYRLNDADARDICQEAWLELLRVPGEAVLEARAAHDEEPVERDVVGPVYPRRTNDRPIKLAVTHCLLRAPLRAKPMPLGVCCRAGS